MTIPKDYLSRTQAAQYLGVCTATISRYCESGKLLFYQFGKRKIFLKKDLDNLRTISGPYTGSHASPINENRTDNERQTNPFDLT